MPVCLGLMDLVLPFYYDGGVFEHIMRLSWAWRPLPNAADLVKRPCRICCSTDGRSSCTAQARSSWAKSRHAATPPLISLSASAGGTQHLSIVGQADNSCFNFGNLMENTDCYHYGMWLPGKPALVGPVGCTTLYTDSGRLANHEKMNVNCNFFTELNCKGGKVDRLPGCTEKLWHSEPEHSLLSMSRPCSHHPLNKYDYLGSRIYVAKDN